jgi:6-pyruvoyl-tetrahydropterin synthase
LSLEAGMPVIITISGGPFEFSAAHAGLHDGQFEPLHGHTYIAGLRLHGDAGASGMLTDFRLIKQALREAVAPLRSRTLMPQHPPGGSCRAEDGQVFIECGATRFSFPAAHVTLLPVPNTTTEAIAGWLLSQLLPRLKDEAGLTQVDLTLAEAADTSATVTAVIPPGAPR